MAIAEPAEMVDTLQLHSEDGRLVLRVTEQGQLIFGEDFGTADAAKHFAEVVNKIMEQRNNQALEENTRMRQVIWQHFKDKGGIRLLMQEQLAEGEPDFEANLTEIYALIEKKCG